MIEIKVLKDIPGYNAGKVVKVKDNAGIPLDKFWRDRLRDAAIDGRVEIVKAKKPKKSEGDK